VKRATFMAAVALAVAVAACSGEAKAPPAAPLSEVGSAPVPAAAPAPPPRTASAPSARVLPGAALHGDVVTLRRTFEALHPGLHRYNTAAELDAAFADLDASVRDGATLAQAFLAFSVLATKLRCGHTFLNPTNQSDEVRRALFTGPHLPLTFRWRDGRIVVTGSTSPEVGIIRGTEITAIDGVPAREILARLLTVSRADGANDDKRVANLDRRDGETNQLFDIAFPLFYPRSSDRFVLDVVPPGEQARRVTVRGARDEATDAAPPSAASPTDPALWSLRFLDEHTGYLAMPSWVTYHGKWDWKGDLHRVFADLAARHATSLIVDLRGNEGGTDVGNDILGHYLDAPLPLAGLERWTRYRRVPDDLRPNLDTWDKSFFDWGASAEPLGDGFFRLTKYDDGPQGDTLLPLQPRARAKLVVLVDAENSSATFQFAQVVQQRHLGTLIGEPTGGNQRGINGGAFFFLRLPGSGLEIDLPLIGRFPRGGHPERLPDAGLTPDVVVRATAADIAAGRDPVLAAARVAALPR
jgi:hypothetical protein